MLKKLFLLFLFVPLLSAQAGQKYSLLNYDGVVPPSKTTTQRDALTGLVAGQWLYNSTTTFLNWYDGTAWRAPIKSGTASIVNADVSTSAAIARSKIAAGTASHVVIDDGGGNLSSEATLAKSRGGAGADMSSVTFPSSGTIVTTANSQVLCDTANGHGSTGTKVRKYTNCTQTGTDVVYAANPSNNGDTFTIATAGVYAITVMESNAASTDVFGISLNGGVTTNIDSLTSAGVLCVTVSASGAVMSCHAVARLAVNDVIRSHDKGGGDGTSAVLTQFRIVRVN